MFEENISQRNPLEVSNHANAVKRFENLEKLKLIERLETIQRIKKSNDRLEIKKFMFQLQQRMFDEPDQFSIIKFSIGLRSVEKLKRDSKLSRSPDSRQTTAAEKQTEIKEIEVKPFKM
ncbi:unnamed protein product (macronuclear) [Paramecium tetraurelia]|uniref:Uncharacterized protein n=1 Tax=Paramecium tetraurelia TaxID=5888 RepID=A0DJQ3_PARTE|nr:uncharacterized protein GSPATT00017614001 [Paramecium tetraurelia]CAK83270.1 unnamed protein product [Paramecium tetraurelia]|eukprot:XP_001450667.1 hypothetical protein (macronuclear) [Paramecium tetraurelia strain d4-2]